MTDKIDKEVNLIIANAFFKARWVHKYVPLAYIVDYRNSQGTATDPGNKQ